MITLVVQVNGRLRDRIEVPADISEQDAQEKRSPPSVSQSTPTARPSAA